MPDPGTPIPSVPDSKAVPKNRTRLSLVWFIPIVAAIAGVWIAVTRVLNEGPKITRVDPVSWSVFGRKGKEESDTENTSTLPGRVSAADGRTGARGAVAEGVSA